MADQYARIPRSACPHCGHEVDAASAINNPGIFRNPEPGDTTVCIECCGWLIFRDDLSLRTMSAEEQVGLEESERQALVKLTRAVRQVHELQAQRPKLR